MGLEGGSDGLRGPSLSGVQRGLEQSEEIGRRLQGRGRRESSFPPVLLAAASHASSLGPLRERLTGRKCLFGRHRRARAPNLWPFPDFPTGTPAALLRRDTMRGYRIKRELLIVLLGLVPSPFYVARSEQLAPNLDKDLNLYQSTAAIPRLPASLPLDILYIFLVQTSFFAQSCSLIGPSPPSSSYNGFRKQRRLHRRKARDSSPR
jgi:hypothetical protein